MSAKTNTLRAAMLGVQGRDERVIAAHAPLEAPKEPRKSPIANSRIGLRAIGAHVRPEAARQLRLLAAESERTVQDLMVEAVNDLFRKHNKSAIA